MDAGQCGLHDRIQDSKYSLRPIIIQGILTFWLQCLTIRLIKKLLKLFFILFMTYFIIQNTLSITFCFLYLYKFFK